MMVVKTLFSGSKFAVFNTRGATSLSIAVFRYIQTVHMTTFRREVQD